RFANAINYRGFPHMPGNDFVTAVAQPGSTPQLGGGDFGSDSTGP
ncbi:MAG: phage BR0599 family protein, partial [Hyphomicrobiaceae bacterium]